jgi:hypothetical protein
MFTRTGDTYRQYCTVVSCRKQRSDVRGSAHWSMTWPLWRDWEQRCVNALHRHLPPALGLPLPAERENPLCFPLSEQALCSCFNAYCLLQPIKTGCQSSAPRLHQILSYSRTLLQAVMTAALTCLPSIRLLLQQTQSNSDLVRPFLHQQMNVYFTSTASVISSPTECSLQEMDH